MSSDQPVAPHAIPSHPAPTDAAATSSGVQADATKQVSGSTTVAASAARTAAERHAMEHADSWKPSLDRRQSWNQQDQKRALQMTGIQDGGRQQQQQQQDSGAGVGFTK